MSGPILQALSARDRERGPFGRTDAAGEQPWRHWKLARDEQDTAWLLFDTADTGTNVLSEDVLNELGAVLAALEREAPAGLVLRSAKANNFCVGADLTEFRGVTDPAAVQARLEAAHAVADRLAALPVPKVAVVHGTCLGGGLELALCCDRILAVPGASLGLPEIRLGLHPGLGGTARLPQRIDPTEAMTLMLTGRTVDAHKALKLGLADEVVEERHVRPAVAAALSAEPTAAESGLKSRLLATRPARQLAARQMRSKAAEKAPPAHYPAPGALIALWEEHGGDPEAMRAAEIPSFAGLVTGSTAQNLIRVFFLREQLKKLGAPNDREIGHVHVIGAGEMGGDIAAWCALQGLRVSVFDMQSEVVAGAVAKTAALCERRRLSATRRRDVLDRLVPDLRNAGAARADVVIEAVPEQIEVKRSVYAEVEPKLKPGAILATNTSSIPLEQLAEELDRPERLVGLHFFNPVARMPLIEVVHHEAAEPATLETARAFAGRIDRLPAPVASAPGFLVNRALMPYLLEAITLLDEGAAPETLDRAAEQFGMPVGPVELADQVGLDICLDVADMLRERLPGPMAEVPGWFREKVADGQLGRKTGHGFYAWGDGEAEKRERPPEPEAGTADRMLLPLLNAGMTCLSEGVIEDEDLLDGAMVFGTGFAPFRGGPLHYARTRGFDEVRGALAALAERHGERFAPDRGWTERA